MQTRGGLGRGGQTQLCARHRRVSGRPTVAMSTSLGGAWEFAPECSDSAMKLHDFVAKYGEHPPRRELANQDEARLLTEADGVVGLTTPPAEVGRRTGQFAGRRWHMSWGTSSTIPRDA